jgi:dynein regulatory complex protein 1
MASREVGSGASSRDKDARKSARRERVAARLAALEPWRAADANEHRGSDVSPGEQQVADSRAHLDKKKAAGIDRVTAIRTIADERESERRQLEDRMRQARLDRLNEDAARSGKQNAAVEMRWAELLEKSMPQELHAEIESQRKACEVIIRSKDELISDFHVHLKAKDEEYVKALKQQGEEIEELLRLMKVEFTEIQEEYEVEVECIEDAHMRARDELLEANRKEVDALFEQRRHMELSFMESKQARREQYQAEVEALICHDGEEYQKLKVKLETDIQTLEQQLEEMRAAYQLNTEKLEYNYRVLTERDMENCATLTHQKRKLTKLKDSLNTLVTRYQESDGRDRKRNDELTEEYRRITRQYKDLQSKFRHFEQADNAKYQEVWDLHKGDVMQLIKRALMADEIICQQQLGWGWRGPDIELLERMEPNLLAKGAFDGARSSSADTQGDTSRKTSENEGAGGAAVNGTRAKAVLTLLAREANFLMDAAVQKALESMRPEEAGLASAEDILKALGVTSEADLQSLLTYFFSTTDPVVDEENFPPSSEFEALGLDPYKEPEALRVLLTIIKPDDVIAAVHSFVEDRKEARMLEQARSKNRSSEETEKMGAAANDAFSRHTSKEREKVIQARERQFWERLGGIMGPQAERVWRELEEWLGKYSTLLQERSRRVARVQSLQRENAEYRTLLEQYASAPVNDKLLVPPAQIVVNSTRQRATGVAS